MKDYKFYWDTFLDGEILIIKISDDEKESAPIYGPFVIDKENNITLPFSLVKELIEEVENYIKKEVI